jgi:hypothetical protein
MQRFDRRSWRPPIYKITHACLITSAMLLLGCDIHKSELKCEDAIEAYDKQRFEGYTDELGSAIDPKTGITWYRCPAGKRFVNYVCKGETLRLSWDEAVAFASEFSEKSGVAWRLPTRKEMKSIIEPNCIAPALNPNVFKDAEVANHWLSDPNTLHQDQFRCAINSYSGNISCRQARIIKQPFMLVRDR